MFEIAPDTDIQAPDRLLKARVALRRLRPLKLATIDRSLRDYLYRCQALRLMTEHFPDDAHYLVEKLPSWDSIFNDFCNLVEAAGWFELDWDAQLDPDYQMMMEGDDGGVFAHWMWEIPILTFGFSDYDDNWQEQYPGLTLLRYLLIDVDDGQEEILQILIDDYDLDLSAMDHLYRSDLWEHLESGDFAGYDKPLCWLPEIARIVCGRTGNPILDTSNYCEEESLSWTWAEDLEKARRLWAEARPSIIRWREFCQWCVGQDDMQAVVDALCGPARKRRRARKMKTLAEILTPEVEKDL